MKVNKGEWSEFYAFLKILEDKNLETIKGKFFIIQKVIRGDISFDITGKTIIILNSSSEIIKSIKDLDLPSKLVNIFEKIKSATSTIFEIEETKEIMKELHCTKIKANNLSKAGF